MKVRVSAVFERAGEILSMKYIYGGKEIFSLPGGGVENNLSLEETLSKEWREELGIKVDLGDIILVGEAPAGGRQPRTLHIVFQAREIYGTPKLQPDATHSHGVVWLPMERLISASLYPDVGKQLYARLAGDPLRSLSLIRNRMESGGPLS